MTQCYAFHSPSVVPQTRNSGNSHEIKCKGELFGMSDRGEKCHKAITVMCTCYPDIEFFGVRWDT